MSTPGNPIIMPNNPIQEPKPKLYGRNASNSLAESVLLRLVPALLLMFVGGLMRMLQRLINVFLSEFFRLIETQSQE